MPLASYLLTEKLGEGGAGAVYKAYDRRQGRTVALKLTHPVARLRGRQERLTAEATALSLKHPNIVALEQLETLDDGRLLLVMPFVEGKTLEKLLVPVAPAEALRYVTQAATGLAYAHDQGVLHCDIKPANLMLSRGTVTLLDFGLSRLLADAAEGLVGTLEYLSPEAARGQALGVTSDLWSLGVVFYELLTGHSPFGGSSSAAVLRRVAEEEPLPPSRRRPGLPAGTDQVVGRLLSKDPSRRYPNAAALLSDLAALEAGEALSAPIRPELQPESLQDEQAQDEQVQTRQAQLLQSHPNSRYAREPEASSRSAESWLPPKPALLLGRDDERALLALYLQDPECRLLSLQGLGGVGKTHLGLWVGYEQQHFSHVHFVPLADVGVGGWLAAVAAVLGAQERGSLEDVRGVIARRQQLLILDNFEQLRSQAALLEALLASCPNLTIFLTTRERLGIDAEWVVPLQGLSVPPHQPEPADALRYGSLALFAQRASVHGRSFDLTAHLASVFAICSRLQGHPLGISLAAGLLGELSPAELAARLEHSAALPERGLGEQGLGEPGVGEQALGTQGLNDPPLGRHRSLRAVFEQSFAVLTPEQQQLLCALAMFEGGFEGDAALAVTGADAAALEALTGRSLLGTSLEGRYLQHPVVYSFARERLQAAADNVWDPYRRRYREHYYGVLQGLNERLKGRGRKRALEQLGRDLANFSAALRQHPRELVAAVAEPLRTFYTHYGRYAEGLALFEAARGPYARACAGWFQLLLGELEQAARLAAQGLAAAAGSLDIGSLADAQLRLLSLNTQAGVLARQNELEQAKAVTLEALGLAESLADAPMVTACMTNLAMLEELLGQVPAAITYYEQSLAISEHNQNHPQTLTSLNNLAVLRLDARQFDEAKALLERALVLCESSKLTRMKPLLQINFGLCLHAEHDYANAEVAYLEAYRALLERDDKTVVLKVQAYLGQNYAAQAQPDNAHAWLLAGLAQAQHLGDAEGSLCALVRFAELLKTRDARLSRHLAALVYGHPFTDPADRQLAQELAPSAAGALTLETATAALAAPTLSEAVAALSAALSFS